MNHGWRSNESDTGKPRAIPLAMRELPPQVQGERPQWVNRDSLSDVVFGVRAVSKLGIHFRAPAISVVIAMVDADGGGVVFQSAFQVTICDITLALPVRIHSTPLCLTFLYTPLARPKRSKAATRIPRKLSVEKRTAEGSFPNTLLAIVILRIPSKSRATPAYRRAVANDSDGKRTRRSALRHTEKGTPEAFAPAGED